MDSAQNLSIGRRQPNISSFGAGWLRLPAAIILGDLFKIPQAVWARIVALVMILAGLKLALIIQLAPHLFQVHWRVGGNELTWEGRLAFITLVGLGASHLILLARDCKLAGIKAVRMTNATIVFLGLTFIFLNFHNGDKNYIYPILAGFLKWSSLGPYLSLDFFFQQPFLFVWLFIYGLTYYFLARTGRERWVIELTAVFAALYALIYLEELAWYRNELFAIDVLGFVALLPILRKSMGLPLAPALAPLLWTGLFTGLILYNFGAHPGPQARYFTWLMIGSVGVFAVVTLVMRKFIPGSRWPLQVCFFLPAFVLLTNHHYPVSDNYNQALWLGLEFPRYFVGELTVGLILLFLVTVSRGWFPRLGLIWLDTASLLIIALALVDFRLTGLMGVRLDWNVFALGNSPKMMWRMAQPYFLTVLLTILLLGAFYKTATWLIQKYQKQRIAVSGLRDWKSALWYLGATFVGLGFLGSHGALPDKARGQASLSLAATSPWWKKVAGRTPNPQRFFDTARSLGVTFNSVNAQALALPPRDLNVLLVFMESTYNQHLSLFGAEQETQPLLSRYRDHMELFPNFFSCFASSIHARFATFTSLYPAQDYNAFTIDRVPVKSIFEVLHDEGYSCSLFYSSFADFTGFRDFLKNRGLDEMYDADSMPGKRTTGRVSWGLQEEETLAAMQDRIRKYSTDGRRFFLTYVPAAPHYPYDAVPERFRKFKPPQSGDYTALYLNELLYMDWVIASLIDQLKESSLLDKTLVIITDDHGELLGRNNGPIGHGWLLTPELVNAPLIVMDPEKPGYCVNTTVGSQVDLLPTLCERLRIPLPKNQLYQGRPLDSPSGQPSRTIYLNSFQQYAVIAGDRLVFGDREKEQPAASNPTYTIRNDGSKTIFVPDPQPQALNGSIRRFDEFQGALLRNYSDYAASPTGVTSSFTRVARH